MNEKKEVRILMVEDLETDAFLVELELRRLEMPYVAKRVWTGEDFLKELKDFAPDIILSDFNLPQMNALDVLQLRNENNYAHIPCILVTGTQTDEVAVDCLKKGAMDYIHKTSTSLARLPQAILNALKMREMELENDGYLKAMNQKTEEFTAFRQDLAGKLIGKWEGKVVELMKEVDSLRQQLGQPKKYGNS